MQDVETALSAFEAGSAQDISDARKFIRQQLLARLAGLLEKRMRCDEDASWIGASEAMMALFRLPPTHFRELTAGKDKGEDRVWRWLVDVALQKVKNRFKKRDQHMIYAPRAKDAEFGVVSLVGPMAENLPAKDPEPLATLIWRERIATVGQWIKDEVTELLNSLSEDEQALTLWVVHKKTGLFGDSDIDHYRECWLNESNATRARVAKRVERLLARARAVFNTTRRQE